MVRVKGLEPPRLAAPDPKSGASTNSATPALRPSVSAFNPIIVWIVLYFLNKSSINSQCKQNYCNMILTFIIYNAISGISFF